MDRRSVSRVIAFGAALLVLLVPTTLAGAAPPTLRQEAYPPAAIVNLIDPFGCAPTTISGAIGAVQPGSTVILRLVLLVGETGEEVLSTVSVTAAADGRAVYSIPVPPDRFGPVVVRAIGTNTIGQPFFLETPGSLVACPPLPATGSAGIGNWLRSGTAAVLSGVALIIVAMRRRRHSMSEAG